MRQGKVYVNGMEAGILREDDSRRFTFSYKDDYTGAPVCLTMPLRNEEYKSDYLFPFSWNLALGLACQTYWSDERLMPLPKNPRLHLN